jgi:hypothetical protein
VKKPLFVRDPDEFFRCCGASAATVAGLKARTRYADNDQTGRGLKP